MRRGHLTNHILAQFKDREVSTITSADIDDWLLGLNVANATKNHIMDTFRVVLDEAKQAGLLKENVARQITQFARNQRDRDILTPDEIKNLFPSEIEKAISIWGTSIRRKSRPEAVADDQVPGSDVMSGERDAWGGSRQSSSRG
jgi:hypothetical protein